MTTYTIPPSYGAEIKINEEGNIVIYQGENDAILLTPGETEKVIAILQKLLLELRNQS